jgi:bacteriocin-like protein
MMKDAKVGKKLVLSKETVKVLTEKELAQVAGGWYEPPGTGTITCMRTTTLCCI